MEHEIEEAQRQIRRSAAIIQDAFEGLTALQRLHNRVSEASPSARSLTDTSSAISTTQFTQDRAGSPGMPPNSMDPGHDVIVISAENSTLPPPSSTSTSVPVPQTQPRTSSSSIIAPLSPRGPRPSDPALAALGSELRTMTQSFRERVGEFDELRRAIAQYAQERHNRGVTAERARSRSPPPNAEPYNPVPYQPLYPEANSSSPEVVPPGTAQAASETNAPRRFDGRIRPIRGGMRPSNRPISLLRPREGNESETSLGMLVAARTAASSNDNNSVADTPTITPATISASVRSTGDRPRPVAFPVEDPYRSTGGRPSSRALPSNITARITRLAQEIQQEGARITQQAESLRSWINERNSRLDALRPSASVTATRNIFSGARPISTIGMDLNPTMILGEEYEPAPIPNLAPPPRFTTDLFPEPSMVPLSEIPRANEPVRGRELPTDTSPARSRRTPEGAVRARYLRQNVPTNWSAMVQSASNTREDRSGGVPWNSRRERTTDGPLSPPSRTIGLTGHRGGLRDAGTSMSASTGTALDDFEVESYNPANSVRAALAIARTRSQGRVMDVADDDEDFTDSRSYRVRRRYNADGDEEVIRIPLRRETSSSSLPGPELSLDRRPPPLELEDDGEEEDSWMEAISRLDTMSRRSAARVVPPEDSRHPPRMVRGGTQLGTAAPPPAAFPAYSANLAGRRSTRGWRKCSLVPALSSYYSN